MVVMHGGVVVPLGPRCGDSHGEGHDKITGNGGKDNIAGGAGNDTINGTDEIVAGYYEIDILYQFD